MEALDNLHDLVLEHVAIEPNEHVLRRLHDVGAFRDDAREGVEFR